MNGRLLLRVVLLTALASFIAASQPAATPAEAALRASKPPRGAIVAKPPVLRWKGVAGARFYNVQLYRDGKKILTRWPRRSRFELHWHWKHGGSKKRLRSAAYHWYVWPHNGSGYGRRIVRSSFKFGRLPKLVTPPSISGEPREGHVLTASGGQWKGTRPRRLSYRWERCNAAGRACEAVRGEHASSRLLTAADIDATARVVVTAANWLGERTARSAPTSPVRPAPPILVAPPKLIGKPQVGSILTAELGAWSSSRPITYRVDWQICGAAECRQLGAHGRALLLRRSALERAVRFVVSASNAGGSGQAAAPRSPKVGLRVTGTRVGERLVGTQGSDAIRGLQGDDVLVGKGGPDLLVGGGGADRLRAGAGDDRVEAADRRRDRVDCGGGADLALVDRRDIVSGNCEDVQRRR